MYLSNLNPEIKAYFEILSPVFPDWLIDYIETPAMQRINEISMNCGTDYSKVFNIQYWYSNLDHSVGVALIIWNFTRDKKQTLAGLFHDISTPCFKHCIDFLNDDHEKQESTETKTVHLIESDTKIMSLLKRDNILLSEICDYKIYPIADNDTPKMSADRFEYNFSSGLVFARVWDLDKIKKCYDDIIVVKNEDGIDELAFKTVSVGEEYIATVSKLWPEWITTKDKVVMQFIADIMKAMIEQKIIDIDDLYHLSEAAVLNKLKESNNQQLIQSFINFENATTVYESETLVENKYCACVKAKARYIVPLVLTNESAVRINKVSKRANTDIENYLNNKTSKYGYFDFNLNTK